MADETIGGVSISIGGDSSDLKEALDRAIQAAEAAGQNISEAIAKAYESGAGNLKQALDQIAGSADGLKNAAQPMADTVTQAGAALQSTGEQASTAGGKLDEFSEHAHGAGEAAHEAHGGTHELLEGLLEFAGIALTIEALKEFVTEAVEVYAHTEKIQISLGYLSGSSKEAAEEIEKLKGFAMNLAVPFDSAAEAAQKFSASGLEFPQINEALHAAADAAAATGSSFETAAGKIDTLANSTNVSSRMLKTLKITQEDLAEAMNISTDQIKTAWAGMDVEQRVSAITTALEKFKGAGDAVAAGTAGQLQQIKNAWHETMDSVGESIAPITATVLPALLDGFKYVVAGVEGAIGVIKVVVDTVKGVFAEVYSAVSGFAVAVAKVTSGDMKGAVDTLGDTFKNLEIIESATSQKIQSDTLQTAFQLQDLFGKTAKSAEDSGDRQAKAHAAAGAAAALAAAETKKAMEEVEKFGQSAQALLDKIPEAYGDYVSKLQDGGATATSLLKNVSSELDKAGTAMTNLRGEPLRAMQEWVDELKAAQDKLRDFADSDEFRKIGDKVAGIGAKFVEIKPQILNVFNDVLGQLSQIPGAVARDGDKLVTWLGEVVKAQDALDKQIQTTQKTMDTAYIKYEERTRSQTIPITVTLAERLAGVTTGASEANKKLDEMGDNGPGKVLELVTAIGTLHLSVDGLTDKEREALQAFDKIVDSGTTNLPLIEGGWNAVSAAIATLAKVNMPEAIRQQGLYVEALARANKPHEDILRAQEAMYANQIKLAQEQGTGWSAYGIALDEAKRKQQEHIDATGRMYEAYKDLQTIVRDTFKGIEDGIATAIVDGKNLGDTLEAVGKKIAKEFIEDVLKMALDPMKKALEDMVSKLFPSIISSLGGLATIGKDAQSAVDDLGHSVVMAAAGFGQAGEAAGKMATSGTTAVGTATSGITGVGGAASSATTALTGWISAIGSAVGALASIGSFVTSLETNHKLAVIEENTRKTEILLDQIGHGIWTGTDLMTGYLNNIMEHAWTLPDISAHTLAAAQWLEQIVNGGVAIVGALGAVAEAIQHTKTAAEGTAASAAAIATATQATAVGVEASGRTSTSINEGIGALTASSERIHGAAQTSATILASLQSALDAAKTAIDALEARQVELLAAEQAAIERGDLNAAAVIQAEIDSTTQQIEALKSQVPNITAAIAQQSGVIQQEGVSNRGAIARSQDEVKAVLQTEHDVLIKMAQDQTDIGNATQAAIFKAQADAVQQQIDAIGTSTTKIEGAIGREEQSGKTNTDKITTAIQISGTGSLTALFGMRDTLIAGLTAARDQIVALQRSLIAAGEISTAATLDVQINGLNAQITALKTSTAAVTAATAGGAAAITGVIGTAADGIKDTFSSGTGNVVDTLTVGFKAITDSQVAGAQQVAAAVVASSKMGVNPLTGNIPPGTFPGETYGATGNPIAPGFYFNSGSIAQRQTESQLAQAALYAGDWNAWQYALSTFAAASGGSIPAWAEVNPGTGVAYTPEDLAANAAAHHTGGSITGLHSFDTGGLITEDQVAQVHAGELVLTADATQKIANYAQQTAELQREIADIQKRIDVELRDGNLTGAAASNLTLETLRHQLTETTDAQAAVKAQWMEEMAKLNTQEIILQTQLAAQQQQSSLLTDISQILPTLQLPAGFQGAGLQLPAGFQASAATLQMPAGFPASGLPPIMNPPAGGSPGNGPVPLASAITNLENYLESQLTTEELCKLRAQIGNESLIDYYRHNLTQAEWANIQRFVGTPGLFPSFATGIDYVPYDMTARIHEGERVLNRGEAQAYGTGPQNINITVNGANVPNPRELARMIGDHVKSVTSNNQVRR